MFKNSDFFLFEFYINATDTKSMKPGTNPKKFGMLNMFFL